MTASELRDRIDTVTDMLREQQGHEWGTHCGIAALREELDQLLHTEPEEE